MASLNYELRRGMGTTAPLGFDEILKKQEVTDDTDVDVDPSDYTGDNSIRPHEKLLPPIHLMHQGIFDFNSGKYELEYGEIDDLKDDPGEMYKQYARRNIENNEPTEPFFEADKTKRDPGRSKQILNLHYNSNRGNSKNLPQHSEMFMGYTDPDPRGTDNDPLMRKMRDHVYGVRNNPLLKANQARDMQTPGFYGPDDYNIGDKGGRAARWTATMTDSSYHHQGDREANGVEVMRNKQQLHIMARDNLKIFSIQRDASSTNNNTLNRPFIPFQFGKDFGDSYAGASKINDTVTRKVVSKELADQTLRYLKSTYKDGHDMSKQDQTLNAGKKVNIALNPDIVKSSMQNMQEDTIFSNHKLNVISRTAVHDPDARIHRYVRNDALYGKESFNVQSKQDTPQNTTGINKKVRFMMDKKDSSTNIMNKRPDQEIQTGINKNVDQGEYEYNANTPASKIEMLKMKTKTIMKDPRAIKKHEAFSQEFAGLKDFIVNYKSSAHLHNADKSKAHAKTRRDMQYQEAIDTLYKKPNFDYNSDAHMKSRVITDGSDLNIDEAVDLTGRDIDTVHAIGRAPHKGNERRLIMSGHTAL